jgi:aspartate aminotransferase
MLAQRTSLFQTSGTANARAAAKAATDAGKEIVDLTCGEILGPLAPTVRDGAIAAIRQGLNRYTETVGMPELRDALARKMSIDTGQIWTADEIAVTAGAKQALFNAAMVLLNAGDEVIVPAPYWTTFPAQVLLTGAKPVFVETRQTNFVPDLDAIERVISPRTRAIIVNSPNNPTGAIYSRDTLAGIAKLAAKRELWIIFDECYGAFTYDSHRHHSILAVAPDVRARTLIVNAFSKSLAMTGWRIGYLAAPKSVITAIKALQSHTTSNPNVIAQHAILAHLSTNDTSFEDQLRQRLSVSRQIGLAILSGLERLPVPNAEGGFYFYLDLSALLAPHRDQCFVPTADDVVNALLAKSGVAAVSGTAFGDGMGLRLSYSIPNDKLEAGLTRLVDHLNAWR